MAGFENEPALSSRQGSPGDSCARVRREVKVHGIVQGVGFRPFVCRLASTFGLSGFIRNTSSGVAIEVEGESGRISGFLDALVQEAPPLARISCLEVCDIAPVAAETGFVIAGSSSGDAGGQTLISPDIALCRDCLHELADPSDRRYRYPFVNCTNCGPRYTIVERIPYDRPFTSMKSFALCPDCGREYHDLADRRFHAQPNACSACGPSLSLLDASGRCLAVSGALAEAARFLKRGMILAVKGIGGFHLAVDASAEEAVRRLRRLKGREEKPFAVMARSLAHARVLCLVDEDEAAALASPEAPIMLLKKRVDAGAPPVAALAPFASPAPSVAGGNDRLGVMLPYSPLHWLLLQEAPPVLVMTSANVSDEPIACDNDEAIQRLGTIADAFLVHNRPVVQRCDDSVAVRLSGKLRMLRRSRGYVPAPIVVGGGGPPVLGTGGELKNTLCLLRGGEAIMSQHIGDMKNYEAYCHFESVARHLQEIFRTEAELIVHDSHPSWLTTSWALGQEVPSIGVQHHHAHLAACLAEHRDDGPAIGLILDGAGYGTDGTVWGGEVLVGNAAEARRFASIELMPLPGGDAAVHQPWRAALGYLYRSGASMDGLPPMRQPLAGAVLELLEKRTGCVETSSCGRLFDAVASICGLRHEVSHEGQAAVELMQSAGSAGRHGFSYGVERQEDGLWRMLVSPFIRELAGAVRSGMDTGEVSQRFHRMLVNLFSEVVRMAYLETGIRKVVFSGGVFQNELLFETLLTELAIEGFEVLTHELVPSGDGGLSLGQALIGRHYLNGLGSGLVF